MTDFRQSIFQRIVKNCDVLVYSKGGACHRIRNVNLKKAQQMFEKDVKQ